MRTIAITFAALFLSIIGAHADGTWCANYGVPHSNCGFYSFEQCMAALSGNGGFCQRNPFTLGSAGSAYGYAAEPPRGRYRRHL
jgi:hypothetical protein